METRYCLTCDKEFSPRAYEDEFCSQVCADDYESFMQDGECDEDDFYFNGDADDE